MSRTIKERTIRWSGAAALLLAGLPLTAQPMASSAPPPPPTVQAQPEMGGDRDQGPMAPHRPPMEHAFRMGPRGRWWDDQNMAQKLGLSADQKKKMDDIFLQSRLKLIDEHASVEKEETILEPLLSAEQPDESRILAQIDKVAQSRAELEKSNARMLLGLRGVLTTAQWKTLQAMDPGPSGHGPDGRFDRRDRRDRRGPDDRSEPPPPPPPSGAPGGAQ